REATEAAPAETVLPRNMMEQITAVIEEKELYRRKNLRITDVATELATNKTYVSVLLNNMSGESFTQLITRYRVRYAQKLLREQPEMLLDEIAEESGFSSRTTFFRNFKALTGMTPLEWRISK
ncbi:MAG: helix-turn-helix domain-containing protein, partial [Bacteroidales bacterium]|nr:helix-turn-helix domain-containing protein [Bacteroidales bacterium]